MQFFSKWEEVDNIQHGNADCHKRKYEAGYHVRTRFKTILTRTKVRKYVDVSRHETGTP